MFEYDLMSICMMRMATFLMHARPYFMLESGDVIFNIKNKKTFIYNSQHMEGTVGMFIHILNGEGCECILYMKSLHLRLEYTRIKHGPNTFPI
mgnify:CR=1 FL=1